MNRGGTGGANTQTGLRFEEKVDFLTLIQGINGYEVKETKIQDIYDIFYKKEKEPVAKSMKKHGFYRYLESQSIDWKDRISARLLPDDALLVIVRETLFIIEVKYQQVEGSVDEKLQTCDFKKKQYQKLLKPLGLKVEYVYVLNDFFKKKKYKDVLNYIESVNCHYMFDHIPLAWLGLPNPIAT